MRAARQRAGLTQDQLAARMGCTQSAVSDLEGGRTRPLYQTVARNAAALGGEVTLALPGADPLARARADIERSLTEGDPSRAFRAVLRMLCDLDRRDRIDASRALRLEPATTGSPRWDALLAAAVEHATARIGVGPPSWTAAPSKFLDRWWFPVEDMIGRLPTRLAAYLLANAPGEFAARGVFVDRASLRTW